MNPAPACQRPPLSSRRFHSPAVEDKIREVGSAISDPELAWMFRNCLPNTLDTTVFFDVQPDGHPDSYVITGDIPAMWLRDSTAQVWPFLPLAPQDEALRALLEGVIRRQARNIRLDPYANAFYRDAVLGEYQNDLTEMRPGIHERKWELDSLAAFLRLSCGYWKTLRRLEPFDASWVKAVLAISALLKVEQGTIEQSPYRFLRRSASTCSLSNYGMGDPCRPCGLVRSGFRPSDDSCKLPYHVPSNAMLAVTLEDSAPLLDELGQTSLSASFRQTAATLRKALTAYARIPHPVHGEIWCYEVDGYGGRYLMDDANVPSLLSLPYLGFGDAGSSIYLQTRAFCLSPDNPYFSAAGEITGIGSPHTARGWVWPLSIIMRALTSRQEAEILACLRQLKLSHAGTGFMHEAFDPRDPSRHSRPWFAWANTLFGELILNLHRTCPKLLQTSLSSS